MVMIKQAVLLVGGLGTRLGARTRVMPKPLLDVGGRPFLAWLLDELRRHGLSDLVLLAGFRGERLREILGEAADLRILIEPEPLGTGGALRFARDHLDNRFFFLNGDSLFDINLWDLAATAPDAEATLAVRRVEDISRYGQVLMDGARVTGFGQRTAAPAPGLINGGVGVLSRRIVERMRPGPVSIEADVYPQVAADGGLFGRVYDAPFIDIGVPDDFALAQRVVPGRLTRGAIVFDEAALLVPRGSGSEAIALQEGAAAAVKAVNDAGLLAFMIQDPVRGEPRTAPDLLAWRAQVNAVMTGFGAHIDAIAPAGGPTAEGLNDLLVRFRVKRARTAMIGGSSAAVPDAGGTGRHARCLLDTVAPLLVALAR